MGNSITLPDETGKLRDYQMRADPVLVSPGPHPFSRKVFSAVHVVADPFSVREPTTEPSLDWEATLAFRRHILDLGLGIAEAMDTAQRGMGLDWPGARELIEKSLTAVEPGERERIFCGAGTDQLEPDHSHQLDDILRAYIEQVDVIQRLGGGVILMASRALARAAKSPRDYETVYGKVLAACDKPAILHWLGDMFDPALAGYWGFVDFRPALETVLNVIGQSSAKIDGIKISLLDDAREIELRRRLPVGVKLYTGDDFNYPALIKGDSQGFSHALLGIFDAIAPVASAALSALGRGDVERYDRLLEPTVPLSRHIFRAPTQFYKTGIVFLAYLNGFQDHFVMVGGAQAMRPLPYFTQCFRLADAAGLLSDPDRAAARMKRLLHLYGVEA